MTTPQNPGDGDTPQDPSDPQNPYGTPPPPPASPPPPPSYPAPADPAPPTTPIPAAPSPYGEPAPPPAAPQGQPATPPPYGAPSAPAYGQPAAPAYGQPAAPGQAWPVPAQPYGGAPTPEAGKGMAITALIVSFFGCTCIGAIVSIVLSIIVLRRGKDGRNHGKGLAIAAMIVSAVTLLAGIGVTGLIVYATTLSDVNDLKAGDCITANGLTDKNSDTIDTIRTVQCSEEHDGEVLATTEVTAELAENFDQMDPQEACAPAIEAAGKAAVVTDGISLTALTGSDPDPGDNIACVAYHADGSKLTGKLG